jgi:predicted O-linked N-acetylglucosamine transferase (SPINDLY family)
MAAKKAKMRFSTWRCTSRPERLRVGLVSGDMHNHPVGYFLESVLARIDPSLMELIAYPTDYRVDDLTIRIKPYFSA